ncbi:MAG TPA: ZIP family metal transporter [Syntrophomonadaceae bacterium]|nr:ZIP family metal transporter [Syntrophomonadaceae bacterium]HPR93712.1 ZIP family metal transporter [Syntrophomonadaceae bacterium]
MSDLILVSLLAGLCTAVGAILLFIKSNWSNRSLAVFLGLASGVMTAVVLFDMLPSAFLYYRSLNVWAGIMLGTGLLLLADNILFSNMTGNNRSLIGLGYLIMLGIALHDLPEGMAIALGNELKARTGAVIAIGIAIHNIPEGMAIAAPLIMGGMRRSKILLKILLIALVTPAGTLLGRLAVDNVPDIMPFLLGFASGIMIYLVAFQLWPQAGRKGPKIRWLGFLAGMIIIIAATFI